MSKSSDEVSTVSRLTTEYYEKLTGALKDVNKEAQLLDAGGEVSGRDVWTAVAEAARRVAWHCEWLARHEHRWNGEDYCDLCGWDGRA